MSDVFAEIIRTRRALAVAERQFEEADPEHRESAAHRLTAALKDYNAALVLAKVECGLVPHTVQEQTVA